VWRCDRASHCLWGDLLYEGTSWAEADLQMDGHVFAQSWAKILGSTFHHWLREGGGIWWEGAGRALSHSAPHTHLPQLSSPPSSRCDFGSQVDNIAEGFDFSEKITRAKFEELNLDLFRSAPRAERPPPWPAPPNCSVKLVRPIRPTPFLGAERLKLPV